MLHEKRSMPSSAVASELRRRIASGEYRDGEWLPTERELSDSLGVHRRSVRAAIEELATDGLIVVKPRCRPVVREGASTASAKSRKSYPSTAGNTSRLVALLMSSFRFKEGPTAQELIFWGMNRALGEAGYHSVFLNITEGNPSFEQIGDREAQHLQYALDNGFAGIVFYPNAYDRNRQLLIDVAQHMPVVMIDRAATGVEADFVGIDNHRAMYEATRFMIDAGHRHILYVTGSEAIGPVVERLNGHRKALEPDMPETIIIGTGLDRPWPAFEALFRLPVGDRPTAVLCVNDVEASFVATRLTALGFDIPGDVSVIGFDNVVDLLPGGVGLTTVDQPYEQIGESAAQTLLLRLRDPSSPLTTVRIPARLVVRDSVRSPRAG
jgi:DNA-binding LacI/PurR family transcriptional regulator